MEKEQVDPKHVEERSHPETFREICQNNLALQNGQNAKTGGNGNFMH